MYSEKPYSSVYLPIKRRKVKIDLFHSPLQANNPVYQFLSGVRVTPKTHFLDPTNEAESGTLAHIYHFMHFAMAIYGWPMYLRKNTATAFCQLCTSLHW